MKAGTIAKGILLGYLAVVGVTMATAVVVGLASRRSTPNPGGLPPNINLPTEQP